MKYLLSRSLRSFSVVAPPFLYGTRNPLVAGLIRTNDEISEESKKMLHKYFFSQCKLIDSSAHQVEAVEVVSDDSVHRSHDPTHIEAGVGVIIKSLARLANMEIPCAIVMNCMHVGVRNNFKNYHSNQARVMCQYNAEKWIENDMNGRGLVISVSSDEACQPSESEGYMEMATVKRSAIVHHKQSKSSLTMEEIPLEEKEEIFSNHLRIPILSTKTYGLVDKETDALLCGFSLIEGNKSTCIDPFVTTDCPEGMEHEMMEMAASKYGIFHMEYCSNDKFIDNLFKNEGETITLSALPIGLTENEQTVIMKRPWITSGLFSHLRGQLIT